MAEKEASLGSMKIHRLTLVLFLVALIWFVLGNIGLVVTDPVESNYALTAKEMVESGNWWAPQIYHQVWFDKPVLIYWLIALSYKVFGITDFAARFPSALLGALSVGLLYQEIRSISGRRILGLWTAVIAGTSLEFWLIAHGIVTDMALFFASVGTFTCGYRGIVRKSRWGMSLAYGFAAIGVLAKGPVALVLPGLLFIAYLLLRGQWRDIKGLFPWQGILLFLIIAMPWYLYMYVHYGNDFINGFLGLNNVVRATESEHPSEDVWWYYLALFFGASLPWTGTVLYEMISGWKKSCREPFYVYSMVMGWGTILFYSLMATKYPTYTFISLIPFSFLGAVGIIKIMRQKATRKRMAYLIVPAFLLWIVYGVATLFVPWGFWLLLYALIAGSMALILALWLQRGRYAIPAIIAIATMLISGAVLYEGVTPLIWQRSAVRSVPLVEDFSGQVYYYNKYAASLVYYTGKDIVRIEKPNADADEKRSADWDRKYTMPKTSVESLVTKAQKGEPMLVIVNDDDKQSFEQTALYPFVTSHVSENKRVFYTLQ